MSLGRAVIKLTKMLFTGKEAGVASGDGFEFSGDSLTFSEGFTLAREKRLVFSDTLSLLDQQTAKSATSVENERVGHSETPLAFLNGIVNSGPERPIQTPVGTLTTGLGNGGFGQLGFGGTINVTG